MIVSVDSSGVHIGGKSGSSTFVPNPTIAPIPIATVGNNVISAAPEATSIVIGTKTAFLNGPPVTIGESVYKLTPSGLVVVGAGKTSSIFVLPTLAPSIPLDYSTFRINGKLVSAYAGASTIVIGDQTVSMGGPLVTLSNHDVLSLGPGGLVIQMPSGGVSTVVIAPSTYSTATKSKTTSTSKGMASIIASSMSKPSMLWNLVILITL